MKRNEQFLAIKYAKAVYSLWGTQLSGELYEQLSALAATLEEQRSVILLAQIVYRGDESIAVLETFFKNAGFDSIFVPLISLLNSKRRLILLPRILRELYSLYLEDKNIMHFTIESAVDLTQKQQEEFISFLEKKTGKEIRYTLKSNPDLIAGVKMYSDTLGYEHSIQQKLYQL